MALDPISAGLLTSALNELVFRTIDRIKNVNKKELKPKLEVAYLRAINETERKFPNSKAFIERVIKNIRIKNKVFSLRGGKKDIQKEILDFATKKRGKREENLDPRKVIECFYNAFKTEFTNDSVLQEYLKKAYLDEIVSLSKDTNIKIQILPDVFKEVKTLREDVAKLIVEHSIIKKIGKNNFSFRTGAFKIHLYGYSIKDLIGIFEGFYKVEKIFKKGDFTSLEFSDVGEDSNFIKLLYRESFYKVIYPPEKSHIAWLKQELNYVELTCFVGNHYKKAEIESVLKNYVESSKIKEITFDKRITPFLNSHLGYVSHFKYNPRIKRTIKKKNFQHIIKGKIGIFIGDPGFLRDKQIKFIINNLIEPNFNERADVFYFKGEEVPKIFNKPIDVDINRDGRIIGFFPKENLDLEKARMSLYNFISKYGDEF